MTGADGEMALYREAQSRVQAAQADSMEARESRAFERLSEDAMLTGDLTDDDAAELLLWARGRVHQLVAASAKLGEQEAQEYIDAQLLALRRRLRRSAQLCAASLDPHSALKAQLAILDGETGSDAQT